MAKYSKQTYEMVAHILHEHLEAVDPVKVHIEGNLYGQGHAGAIAELQVKFADWFARDNGAFNRAKFYEAVNTGKHIRTSIREA